jgi:hypothetical protein
VDGPELLVRCRRIATGALHWMGVPHSVYLRGPSRLIANLPCCIRFASNKPYLASELLSSVGPPAGRDNMYLFRENRTAHGWISRPIWLSFTWQRRFHYTDRTIFSCTRHNFHAATFHYGRTMENSVCVVIYKYNPFPRKADESPGRKYLSI